LKCYTCNRTFSTPKERKNHWHDDHNNRVNKQSGGSRKQQNKNSNKKSVNGKRPANSNHDSNKKVRFAKGNDSMENVIQSAVAKALAALNRVNGGAYTEN
jgi:hypothetical protein